MVLIEETPMNPFDLIKNFPIRYKLLFIYSTCFLVIMSLSSLIVYSIVKQNVEANIESELKNSTSAIHNTVKTAVSVSIKNRLRGWRKKIMRSSSTCTTCPGREKSRKKRPWKGRRTSF